MNNHILRPVYTGVAVADIEYGSNVLHVKPLESNPSATGEIDTSLELLKVEVETPKGTVESKAIFTDYLTCSWLNRNTNRITAPDVRKGERIQIWQNADSEDFYWETIGIDNHLRTQEHVIFAFSNTNNEDRANKKLDFTNCYIFEFDTVNKKIRIKTNKNDGEPFEYEIVLNTKDGFHKMSDDVGNYTLMDSLNTVIEFMNKDKTQYRMDKKDILEKCDGNRTVIVGGDNTVEITGHDKLTVKKSSTREITDNEFTKAKGIGMEVAESIVSKTGSSFDVDSPVSNFTGAVNASSLAIAPGVSVGAPPRGEGGGYTATVDGTMFVSTSLTTPELNSDILTVGEITGDKAAFSVECTAPNI
ncbi:hypothetical protein TSMG0170 [Halocynthia phage JM-2012]|uniref:baseplate assembly protein n=1 Tax=Halocynthia phage JM-2012 TaxID=1173297 RepID=UPI00025C698C|nr:baseplate assembly protein [Halocynthia phage JM-2012]AFI55453.1 hypothetical protein TSMG0170 [Halocynthia phage JM-2012]